MRRALVSLPDGVWKVIDKELKGKLGDGDSEVIRNIVIAHLTQLGYLLPRKEGAVPSTLPSQEQINEIAGELNMNDAQLEALAELLEEKGLMRYSEFENRTKKKLAQERAEARSK